MQSHMATLQIPIAKGGKNALFSFDSDLFNGLDEAVQLEIIGAGMEKFLNAGMSSTTKYPAPTKLEGEALEEAKTAALAKAEANLKDLQDYTPTKPTVKIKYDASKAKAKPATAEDRQILSEAKRQAIAVLKNRARAQGIKPLSAVPASKWTELALKEIEANPKYLADAKATIASRTNTTSEMDLASLIVLDPVKVAAAKAKSTKAKIDVDQLSATQSGQPKSQGKGKVPPARPQSQPQHTAH
jgi:hypothetical protein